MSSIHSGFVTTTKIRHYLRRMSLPQLRGVEYALKAGLKAWFFNERIFSAIWLEFFAAKKSEAGCTFIGVHNPLRIRQGGRGMRERNAG